MSYKPQLQAVPWAYAQGSTREQQEGSLQLHAEKKALAVLLSSGQAKLNVSINFNACKDCHEFFKSSSQLLGREIQLCQPRLIHIFTDGRCSCNDWWSWESRFALATRAATLEVKVEPDATEAKRHINLQKKQELDGVEAKKQGKVAKLAAVAVEEEQEFDAAETKKQRKVANLAVAAILDALRPSH